MEITWLGHSCFRIKGKEATVITDPCPPEYGCSLADLHADIVTVSHNHPGHVYTDGLADNPRVIKGPGEYEVKGVFITGMATYHDTEGGKVKGKNTVYILEIDGLTVCHLGDLGHLPPANLVDEMGEIQVLMLPVGGKSTLAIASAVELVKDLTPRITIPMHYRTAQSSQELEPVDRFLKEYGAKELTPAAKLSVTRSSLPAESQIVILDYPRK